MKIIKTTVGELPQNFLEENLSNEIPQEIESLEDLNNCTLPTFIVDSKTLHIPNKVESVLRRAKIQKKLKEINADPELAIELCLIFLSNLSNTYFIGGDDGWKTLNSSILESQVKVLENNSEYKKIIELLSDTKPFRSGPIIDASLKAFEDAFTQHLKCNHVLAQLTVPFMKENSYGRIINIISTSVKEPIEGLGVSNTIRNAVGNWSKTLSFELGHLGITVNNILPGFTETERLNEIIKIKAEQSKTNIDKMANIMKTYTPAKRFAKPEETANAIVFLASEAASYINGVNIPVDGGRTKSL